MCAEVGSFVPVSVGKGAHRWGCSCLSLWAKVRTGGVVRACVCGQRCAEVGRCLRGKCQNKGMAVYDGVQIWGGTCVIWRTNVRRLVGNGAQTCGGSGVKLVRNRGRGEVVVASCALLFVVLCRGMSGMPVCLSEWGGAVRRMEV